MMKQIRIAAVSSIVAGCMIYGLSTAVLGQEISAEQLEVGADLYAQYCERCHNPGATGLVEYRGTPEDFRDRLEGITEEMPDFWGMFSDDEVAALYGYLQSTLPVE